MLQDVNDEAYEIDRRRTRQHESMTRFGLFALRTEEPDALLQGACEAVAEGVGAPFVKALRYREAHDDLLVRAGLGWPPGVVGEATLGADHGSPAGYAFLTGEAVRSNDLRGETKFRTPSLLRENGVRAAINVPIADGDRPYGVLEADSTVPDAFVPEDATFMLKVANTLAVALERSAARQEILRMKERQRLLAQEMSHRVRNLFTVVHALIGISERSARNEDDPMAAFGILRERIGALATASTIGTADARSDNASVDPAMLSREVLAPYGDPVTVEGDVPLVPDTWAMPIALVLHELATNAVKHGSLSVAGGKAVLRWSEEDGTLAARWSEHGGPPFEGMDEGRGFGARMMKMVLTQVSGSIERTAHEGGLVATLRIARPADAAP
ncbi:signal transduction histidine kinase [Hasllibacter halocynthiae]|uniref:histidine kinase n=1 Tax=Hasllibacter halocynthiae TaxID=595589 RepID=A0A2T0X9H0_9RHOB|nr:GAF domain-containing protein [Hasllibacter halocynthiae]PRY95586.1 signal transduction histidine kinase [Hasllibacter halocynthiae]